MELQKTVTLEEMKVFNRVVQPIRMVDPQAGYLSFPDQTEYQPVSLTKYPSGFHPDCAEFVDVKKPPVVDLLSSHPPVREAACLLCQKVIEKVEGAGSPFSPVEDLYVLINK